MKELIKAIVSCFDPVIGGPAKVDALEICHPFICQPDAYFLLIINGVLWTVCLHLLQVPYYIGIKL